MIITSKDEIYLLFQIIESEDKEIIEINREILKEEEAVKFSDNRDGDETLSGRQCEGKIRFSINFLFFI